MYNCTCSIHNDGSRFVSISPKTTDDGGDDDEEFLKTFRLFDFFGEIDRVVAIQSVQKLSNSEPSSQFFGNLKFFALIIRLEISENGRLRYKLSEIQIRSSGYDSDHFPASHYGGSGSVFQA